MIARIISNPHKKARLPPGPSPLPIIGNILDLTAHEQWRQVFEWAKRYGDMIFIRVFNTPCLFLNSAEVAMDLLHKRGSIYSDRPHLTMASDLCGFGDLVPLTKYGERFKLERRLMNQALGLGAVEKWQPLVTNETHILLQHLLRSPETFVEHFRRYAGSLIFSAIYGYQITENNDPYVKESEEFMEVSSYAMAGGWVVDFFPWLRYIPGLSFGRLAAQWKAKIADWVEKPHQMFKGLPDSPGKRSSFCGMLLLNDAGKITCEPEYEYRVKWLATSMYGPGSDTTVITLSMLFLALCHYPWVLKKAHQQLDEVLGSDRLPTLHDRPRLSYVDCILKEVLRWGTPVPMTPPHRLIQDDRYREFNLSGGSFCVANMWAILHDEKLYPEPLAFSPERFEGTDIRTPNCARPTDPYNYAFGFGRRRCPGVHFADQSLFLAFASILACFDIAPLTDVSTGQPVLPPLEFAGGAFRHPMPFRCKITPRRAETAALIEAAMVSSALSYSS
ncbi:cytochrome P450 [Cubamyces sp. BRFM 1775]|nr:cytochrome P450 [Cubamyces sp. BRFM 1775]